MKYSKTVSWVRLSDWDIWEISALSLTLVRLEGKNSQSGEFSRQTLIIHSVVRLAHTQLETRRKDSLTNLSTRVTSLVCQLIFLFIQNSVNLDQIPLVAD